MMTFNFENICGAFTSLWVLIRKVWVKKLPCAQTCHRAIAQTGGGCAALNRCVRLCRRVFVRPGRPYCCWCVCWRVCVSIRLGVPARVCVVRSFCLWTLMIRVNGLGRCFVYSLLSLSFTRHKSDHHVFSGTTDLETRKPEINLETSDKPRNLTQNKPVENVLEL